MADTLYDNDLVTWAEREAETLRRLAGEGTNLPLDWENLAEEIEGVGASQRHEVRSLIAKIVVHLLKPACSPARGPQRKWFEETAAFRSQLDRVLAANHSLRPKLAQIVDEEWRRARREAEASFRRYDDEAALAALTSYKEPPFSAEQIVDFDFYPDFAKATGDAER